MCNNRGENNFFQPHQPVGTDVGTLIVIIQISLLCTHGFWVSPNRASVCPWIILILLIPELSCQASWHQMATVVPCWRVTKTVPFGPQSLAVSRKTVQPALEEWAQNPRRTGLDEEADLGEESMLSSEVSTLPPHEALLLPSSLGRLLLSQADCSHIALSSPCHGLPLGPLPQCAGNPRHVHISLTLTLSERFVQDVVTHSLTTCTHDTFMRAKWGVRRETEMAIVSYKNLFYGQYGKTTN